MIHKAVLKEEILHFLQLNKSEWYLDATLGSGMIAQSILEYGANVIGIDCDEASLKLATDWIKKQNYSGQFVPIKGNFRDVQQLLGQLKTPMISGALFDLGISSDQLNDPKRGLSFLANGKLDMRIDATLNVTAADLVNGLGYKELVKVLTNYGEVIYPQLVARAIINYRKTKPIQTTIELSDLVRRAYGIKWHRPIHPATQVFMALRIAVNDELNNLKIALPDVVEFIKPGGRLLVISFHSLEDRIVKDVFKSNPKVKAINKKPVIASLAEININPRARSAKLRVFEKI